MFVCPEGLSITGTTIGDGVSGVVSLVSSSGETGVSFGVGSFSGVGS